MFVFRFCESCLSHHITESVSAIACAPAGFLCPCCRAFTPAKDHSKPRSEWAVQFKTDFVIKELISFRSKAPPEMKHLCPTHKGIACDYYCFDCSLIRCHRCMLESHRACKQVLPLAEAVSEHTNKLRQAIQQIIALFSK